MILLHSNIFKFYEKDKNVIDYTYGRYQQTDEQQQENVQKKNISLLEDLPQLTEDKKNKKKEIEDIKQKQMLQQEKVEKEEIQDTSVFQDEVIEEEKRKAWQEVDDSKKRAKEIQQRAEQEAKQMLEKAKQKAQDFISQAKQQAEQMKIAAEKEGYDQGYQKGIIQGQQKAEEDCKKQYDQLSQKALEDIKLVIESAEVMKEEMLKKYQDQLRDVAVAIAEKVIQVSLKSSGEVIERMIIAATEKLKSREWAKVYIARCDAEMMVEGDSTLLRHLAHLSDHVKIVVMEHETPGTCIIELPDEIIDASASTQMVNIKEILNNASL